MYTQACAGGIEHAFIQGESRSLQWEKKKKKEKKKRLIHLKRTDS